MALEAVVSGSRKEEVITFKVDESLAKAMGGIRNRSEFIRRAILNALDSTCPLCMGSGILTPSQRAHWEEFARHHHVEECDTCHEMHLICDVEGEQGDAAGAHQYYEHYVHPAHGTPSGESQQRDSHEGEAHE
jgi:hypothetical protein